jgi:hypothetical protein
MIRSLFAWLETRFLALEGYPSPLKSCFVSSAWKKTGFLVPCFYTELLMIEPETGLGQVIVLCVENR